MPTHGALEVARAGFGRPVVPPEGLVELDAHLFLRFCGGRGFVF